MNYGLENSVDFLRRHCRTRLLQVGLVAGLVVNCWDSLQVQAQVSGESTSTPLALSTNDSPAVVAESLRQDFHICSDEWEAGLTYPDASVNLFSAWTLTIHRCKSAVTSSNATRSRSEIERALASFVGYVHGRLKVAPPKWWRIAVERARVDLEDEKTEAGRVVAEFSFPFGPARLVPAAPGVLATPQLKVTLDKDRMIIAQGSLSASCPRSLLEAVASKQTVPGDVVVLMERFTDTSVIVVMHGMLPSDLCGIACITIGSNEVRWKKQFQLMPDMGGGYSGRGPWHRVSISTHEATLSLFQASSFGISISLFDLKNGDRTVLFFSDDICVE